MKKKKNKAPYIIIMAAAGVLWALVIVMIVVLGVPDKVNAARVGKQIDLETNIWQKPTMIKQK